MLKVSNLIGFGLGGGGPQVVASAGNSYAGLTGQQTVDLAALGAVSGDLVIVGYSIGYSGSPPAGTYISASTGGASPYTSIAALTSSGTGSASNQLTVAYKVITSDTTVYLSGTGSSSNAGASLVLVVRGQNSTPLDATSTTATGNGSGHVNPPSITVATSALVISIGGHSDLTSVGSYTSPDYTVIGVAAYDTYDTDIGAGWIAKGSGAFDPGAWTSNVQTTDSAWSAVTIAVRSR